MLSCTRRRHYKWEASFSTGVKSPLNISTLFHFVHLGYGMRVYRDFTDSGFSNVKILQIVIFRVGIVQRRDFTMSGFYKSFSGVVILPKFFPPDTSESLQSHRYD